MKSKTALFTGHRYLKSNQTNINGINKLIDYAIGLSVEKFYVGVARGSDLLCAEILSYRELKWTAIIPCNDQTELWNHQDKQRYNQVLNKANNQIILYDKYSTGVMQARNNWMVKHSDICLAIYDGSRTGGTALTVNYAMSNSQPVYQFNPKTNQFNLIQSQQLSLF